MKIVFVSNFFNHHQKYVSDCWFRITSGNYWFIASTEMAQEQKELGYKEYSENYVFNLNKENFEEAKKLVDDADVVIFGSGEELLIKDRVLQKKLVFRYTERIFKTKPNLFRFVRMAMGQRKRFPVNSNVYLLCASAYTAKDFSKMGLSKIQSFKWGYFPEVKTFESIDKVIEGKNKTQILWCGRLLDWKHPDDVIEVARRLKANKYVFSVKIVGNGPLFKELVSQIQKYNLDDVVEMVGALPSDDVRLEMEKSGIYLFTSDFGEGWGAVLNESMSSGCAVIASHAIGAVPYLLKNGKNGMIYHNGDINELYTKVESLLRDKNLQARLGKAGYQTMVETWNPDLAAHRLVDLSDKLLNGKQNTTFSEGPCSKADIISER